MSINVYLLPSLQNHLFMFDCFAGEDISREFKLHKRGKIKHVRNGGSLPSGLGQ